jgi:excisionase family DNA binding protein
MSTGDVAEVLGVSEATVKRWADAGTLSCIRTPGGHRKFRLRDIAMHLASRRRQAGSPSEPVADSDREVDDLVSALLVGDVEKTIGSIAAARLQRTSFATVADTLLVPALRRVRQACSAGRCEAFHQHIAANTLVEATARQRPSLRVPGSTRGRVVAAPAAGEPDDLFARLASLVAVESGFDAHVLGTGLAAPSVSRAAEDLGASWVLLTSEASEPPPGLAEYAARVLAGTERSRARLVCIGEGASRTEGQSQDVLSVRNLREAEGLLAPIALRVAR